MKSTWPYIDLNAMSVVRGPNRGDTPGGFTVLTRGMANGNDYESGFVRIVTFDQGKCSLRKETLTGLILV